MDEGRPGRLVRRWLPVCNIAVLALAAVGSLSYLVTVEMRGGIRPGAAGTHPALEIARLPRPRPDEPAFTASIPPRAGGAAPLPLPEVVEYRANPPEDTLAIYLGDADAILACEDKVRVGLPFPNSLTRLLDTTATRHVPGDGSVVSFQFDAVSGLGFPLRMNAECGFDGPTLTRLQITPRWDAAAADQSVFSIPPSTK